VEKELLQMKVAVQRLQKQEVWVLSQSQFYYEYPYSFEKGGEVEISGSEVRYSGIALRTESLQEKYRHMARITPREQKILFVTPLSLTPLQEDLSLDLSRYPKKNFK
jgi:hypothetical protein